VSFLTLEFKDCTSSLFYLDSWYDEDERVTVRNFDVLFYKRARLLFWDIIGKIVSSGAIEKITGKRKK
jgi:hypothetical protein